MKILEKKAASVEADMHVAALFGGGSPKRLRRWHGMEEFWER